MASKTTQVTATDKPRAPSAPKSASMGGTFSSEDLELISQHGVRRSFAKGLVIISEGECWANYPHIHLKLLKDLSSRVRQLTDELKCVASMDVYQRVTRLLLDLATRENETLVVTQRLTQQDIANKDRRFQRDGQPNFAGSRDRRLYHSGSPADCDQEEAAEEVVGATTARTGTGLPFFPAKIGSTSQPVKVRRELALRCS